jgi:dTDP-4-amino-4,6-dideoxygalactose transaminase
MSVPFHDLRRGTAELGAELQRALAGVLDQSRFVGGEPVEAFEEQWAGYCGVRHAVGCGSGADAIRLALRALGVGPGDAVVVPANTCVPTAAGVAGTGATPVYADVDPTTLTVSAETVHRALTPRTKAIVAVHLYGRCADIDALREFGLPVVEDAAHAHGATLRGRRAGSLGDAAAFSFYPTKNLGALGDAGAVTTADAMVAARVRELAAFGAHGPQSRLDTLQAAVLLAKLPHLDAWNARRRELAARYRAALGRADDDAGHVYHLFVARFPDRDSVRARLAERGIEALIHYAPALAPLKEATRAASEVLSLPLFPQLRDSEVDEVLGAL